MRLLVVPNWSFGRNRDLLRKFRETLDRPDLTLHFCESDPDHNRTVTAFSGEFETVEGALLALCADAFDGIDLNRHVGVHPRLGALDVCPFVALKPGDGPLFAAIGFAERVAARISARWSLPIYLFERSERGRHEADLPTLRRGGFGALANRQLRPDFGPDSAHPLLGVTILGVRDFLIAFNVNLATDNLAISKAIAWEIRGLRADGDNRFLGVRCLGLPLASRNQVQISMNLTLPDMTSCDPIIEWVYARALKDSVAVSGSELIGVIRQRDLTGASRLQVAPAQVVTSD